MSGTFKLFIKANERVFINGAVMKVDRKVGIELLNNVDFLLEQHVLQVEDADTPLKQLYYMIQIILMAPSDADSAVQLARGSIRSLLTVFENPQIVNDLKFIDQMVNEKRAYDALKTLRGLFAIENEIIAQNDIIEQRPSLNAEKKVVAG